LSGIDLIFKRPIVAALLFLSAGIVYGRYFEGMIVFIIACVLICIFISRRMKYPPIVLCAILALAGVLGVRQRFEDNITAGDNLSLQGVVQDVRFTASGHQRLIVRATSDIHRNGLVHAAAGSNLITYLSPQYKAEIGQHVVLRGSLHKLEGARYPGGYDEFMVQRTRKIAAKFFATAGEMGHTSINVQRAAYLMRMRLAQVYDDLLPNREAGLIKSIILGERLGFDEPVLEAYKNAGVYHILVVSGLHLSIFMSLVYLVLNKLLNKRKAGAIALFFMLAYTLLTGAGISTVRAFTMACVALFGTLLYRDRDSLATVSFACIALLIYEPLYLFDIGFQLSFGTVFGIIILTEPFERLLSLWRVPINGKLRAAAAFNLAAYFSTVPVLMYHFYFVSTYGFMVNLIIMPTSTFLVLTGILMGISGLISMGVAAIFAGAIYYLLRFYEAVINLFLSLPAAVWLTGSLGVWATLALMLLMLVFAYAFSGFGKDFTKRLRVLAAVSCLSLLLIGIELNSRQGFHLTDLDMGDSVSYIVQDRGITFVIDGGGNNRLLGSNTGEMVLMPYLDYRGVSTADAAFVSRATPSHIMGIIELATEGRVREIYVPVGLDLGVGLGLRLQVAATGNDIPIYYLRPGEAVEAGDIRIEAADAGTVFILYYKGEIRRII